MSEAAKTEETVKTPKWRQATHGWRPDTLEALDAFCAKSPQYEKREVIDVAIREYLNMPEPEGL